MIHSNFRPNVIMNFQYNCSNYTQDGFQQDQGVQHFLTNQAAGTSFHGVDAKLPKKTKDRLPESDSEGKDKRKKRKHDKKEKEKTEKRRKKTSRREKAKPPKPSPKESAQTSQSERPGSSGRQREQPRIPFPLQPYRIPKVKRPSSVSDQPRSSNAPDRAPVLTDAQQPRRPAPSQSRAPAPAPERKVWRVPTRAHQRHAPYEVPHYYKNHANGSVGNYGDGERIVYMRPEYPGMFPLSLIYLSPLPPGAPRRFHCREYSITITAERRAEREAMKLKAQRNREEAAKITRSGMNCTVLADRKHLPHEPWPREDNWWETGLDEVWKYDECMEGPRDDLGID